MKCAVAVICVVILAATPAVAAVPQSNDAPIDRMERLFAMSESLVSTAKALCTTKNCPDVIAQLQAHIQAGEKVHRGDGWASRQQRTEWRQKLSSLILQLRNELMATLEAQNIKPTTGLLIDQSRACVASSRVHRGLMLEPRLQKAFYSDCADNCDRMLAGSLAVCALYLVAPVAGEIAAAICSAAALVGYSGCLDRCDAQPESGPVT